MVAAPPPPPLPPLTDTDWVTDDSAAPDVDTNAVTFAALSEGVAAVATWQNTLLNPLQTLPSLQWDACTASSAEFHWTLFGLPTDVAAVQPTYDHTAAATAPPSFRLSAQLGAFELTTTMTLWGGFRFATAERQHVGAATAAAGAAGDASGQLQAAPVWVHSRPLPSPDQPTVSAVWDGVVLVAVQVCVLLLPLGVGSRRVVMREVAGGDTDTHRRRKCCRSKRAAWCVLRCTRSGVCM
jgi:hypothetical protein